MKPRDNRRESCQEEDVLKADLASSLPETSDIITAISHDLRSPMNTIIGFSEILLSNRVGELNAEQAKQLNMILNRGTDLLKILDMLIDYCQTVSGKKAPYQAVFALHPFLGSIIDTFRKSLPEKEDLLVYTPPSKSDRVMAEEKTVKMVLEQIFQVGSSQFNVSKIHVHVKEFQEGQSPVPEGRLRIEVAFSGSGNLNPESLFLWNGASSIPGRDRFAMHLSRFYVSLMGGDLSVSRSKGRMVFYLDLPKGEL